MMRNPWAIAIGTAVASVFAGPFGPVVAAYISGYTTYVQTDGNVDAARRGGTVTFVTAAAFYAVGSATQGEGAYTDLAGNNVAAAGMSTGQIAANIAATPWWAVRRLRPRGASVGRVRWRRGLGLRRGSCRVLTMCLQRVSGSQQWEELLQNWGVEVSRMGHSLRSWGTSSIAFAIRVLARRRINKTFVVLRLIVVGTVRVFGESRFTHVSLEFPYRRILSRS